MPSSSPAATARSAPSSCTAEVNAVGIEPQRRLDVVVDHEDVTGSSRKPSPSSTSSSVLALLRRS